MLDEYFMFLLQSIDIFCKLNTFAASRHFLITEAFPNVTGGTVDIRVMGASDPSYSAFIADFGAELIIARQGASFIGIYGWYRCKGYWWFGQARTGLWWTMNDLVLRRRQVEASLNIQPS
ncbi:hypothetical protein B5X24_HaOG216479 [Helicoverpa armigera]|nr:hypothetical protein B5X24_HaOG216479 [Helicoverpa armigera]